MMSKHFKLTNETREIGGVTLHRIKATRDLPHHGVKKGDLGGFVEAPYNLQDGAWCADGAVIMGIASARENACVSGRSIVRDNADISGTAKITNNATVNGQASIGGNSHITDTAIVTGSSRVYGNSLIGESVLINGNADICDGDISHESHVMTFSGVEAYNGRFTLHKIKDGHRLNIGVWSGTVDGLMEEIARRREFYWGFPHSVEMAMVAEYEALKRLCEARIARWEAEDAEEIGWVS